MTGEEGSFPAKSVACAGHTEWEAALHVLERPTGTSLGKTRGLGIRQRRLQSSSIAVRSGRAWAAT